MSSEASYKSIVEATYLAKERMWGESFAENLPFIKTGHRLKELEGKYSGTAIILGAGPSVEKFGHLEILSKAAESNLSIEREIISTDRQLIPLWKRSIEPSFVVTVDGSPKIAEFYDYPSRLMDTYSVLPVYTHPSVVRRLAPNNTYWFVPLLDENWETAPRSVTRFMLWMSHHETVGHAYGNAGAFAWSLAQFLGFTEIILVGLDFSYGPDVQPMGTTYWKSFLEKHQGRTHDAIKSEYRWDSTPFGHRVLTDTIWLGYCDVLKKGIERSKVKTVNTSPYSIIYGKGVESLDLSEALKKYA